MKRFLFITVLSGLVLTLIACDDSEDQSNAPTEYSDETLAEVSENTLVEADLTNRERAILSATTDQSFLFDFNVDPSYKELSVWVEKFEFGKLVDEKIAHLTTDIEEGGQILFSTLGSYPPKNQVLFNASIIDNKNMSAIKNFEEEIEDYSGIWGSNQAKNIPITDEIVLASILYTANDTSMSSPSADFYSDEEIRIEKMKDYEVVYLMKGAFIK